MAASRFESARNSKLFCIVYSSAGISILADSFGLPNTSSLSKLQMAGTESVKTKDKQKLSSLKVQNLTIPGNDNQADDQFGEFTEKDGRAVDVGILGVSCLASRVPEQEYHGRSLHGNEQQGRVLEDDGTLAHGWSLQVRRTG